MQEVLKGPESSSVLHLMEETKMNGGQVVLAC